MCMGCGMRCPTDRGPGGKSYTFVEVECKSVPGRSLLGGRYQVATPAGEVLGTIHRHYGKGVVTHQVRAPVGGKCATPWNGVGVNPFSETRSIATTANNGPWFFLF